MNPTTCAYCAGLLDGEGTITISKSLGNRANNPSHFLRVMIYNTNKALITGILSDVNCGSIIRTVTNHPVINGRLNSKTSIVYCWHTTTNQAEQILIELLPYLRLKKPQAILALEFQKFKRQSTPRRTKAGYTKMSEENLIKREWFKTEISKLNNPLSDEA